MAIKPILFNTNMVRAIMDGRKTCTRRLIKPQWEECPTCKYVHNEYIYDKMAENVYCARCGYPMEPERRSPYQPGDILYVRETWCKYDDDHIIDGRKYAYKADASPISEEARKKFGYRWRPSIHMPKEAARIWLKVTDVRVERLQDMTDDDAEAEGCFDYTSTALGFPDVWDSTIKKSDLDRYGWDASPWVWVIEFERCEKPEGV
jgi:hypothetical protein